MISGVECFNAIPEKIIFKDSEEGFEITFWTKKLMKWVKKIFWSRDFEKFRVKTLKFWSKVEKSRVSLKRCPECKSSSHN